MEPQRNTPMLQNPLEHYVTGNQSLPPWVMTDNGVLAAGNYDRDDHMASNCLPPSIDVDETMSNLFSSLHISPTTRLRRRPPLPDGEIGGGGTSIDGSVVFHPFGNSQGRTYSSAGPVRSCVFEFDQLSDLPHKEPQHMYSSIHDSNFARSRYHQVLSVLPLKELRGRINCLAKDQNGCRLLQAKFEKPTEEEIEMVVYEVLESIKDLMKDQFGNYLIQKLIGVCNDDHKLRILVSLTQVPIEMILVCVSPHGTRVVQKLLETLTDPYHIALATAALGPGAARLANDQNGHHVIQYCLIHFPCDVNEPILNEITDKCFEVATDRSGCCVLQACMENSHGEVRNRLISQILVNAIHLAQHPYGNYVLQHLVGLNVPEFTAQLVRELRGNFASLSCNKYASNVVEKCLNESGDEIASLIVMELITSPNPSVLLTDPYANFVIQCALTVSTGFVYECLREVISDNIGSMRSNLYGKKILAWFEKRRILGI